MKNTLAVLMLALVVSGCSDPAEEHAKHRAWIKVYGHTNLAFEEWKVLYDARMLPGQKQADSSIDDLAIGIAIGTAAGSSAGRSR